MNKKTVIILMSFFLFFLIIFFCVKSKKVKERPIKRYPAYAQMLESSLRVAILQPDRVVENLKIKPGMSILDIGAGSGLFTFHFAEALKGTGKVFATDIELENIEYIKEKAAEKKYENIFPVCVKRDGLDLFYKQHSFNIVFLSDVYYHLWHHKDYFKELRPSLKKEGRLYILQPRDDYNFIEIIFDFKEVIKILISMGEDFPVFQKLSQEVQYFIKNWQGNNVPPEIRVRIVQDFNKILSDRLLFNALLDYYHTKEGFSVDEFPSKLLNPQYHYSINCLVVPLAENGVFDKKKPLTDIDKRRLCRLNRILLIGIFQLRALGITNNDTFILVGKNSIISTLKAAGYQFVREYNFVINHHFLEFKRRY